MTNTISAFILNRNRSCCTVTSARSRKSSTTDTEICSSPWRRTVSLQVCGAGGYRAARSWLGICSNCHKLHGLFTGLSVFMRIRCFTVWYANNGERLGTYKGHNGACWSVDVDWHTKNVVTGSADNSARVWDCQTGM